MHVKGSQIADIQSYIDVTVVGVKGIFWQKRRREELKERRLLIFWSMSEFN